METSSVLFLAFFFLFSQASFYDSNFFLKCFLNLQMLSQGHRGVLPDSSSICRNWVTVCCSFSKHLCLVFSSSLSVSIVPLRDFFRDSTCSAVCCFCKEFVLQGSQKSAWHFPPRASLSPSLPLCISATGLLTVCSSSSVFL